MTNVTLPHWDLSVVYPSLDSPEFEASFQSFVRAVEQAEALFDQHDINRRDPAPLDDTAIRAFEAVVGQLNIIMEDLATLRAYIYAFVSTNSRDERAQACWSDLLQQGVRLSLLHTRLSAWIGSLDAEALIERSPLANQHAFMVRKTHMRAAHLMDPPQEELAAEFGLTGNSAWAKLYTNFTSQILVTIELDGKLQELPMSVIRNLAFDQRREVRQQAYTCELSAWQRAATPIAAALNSIKGETNMLAKRRNWNSPLDIGLFDNNIDRATFDAMLTAANESLPHFRRYLRAKAHALGLPILAWYDIFAPVGDDTIAWTYDEGTRFIVEHFGAFSPRLRDLADRAFQESWIDAEPRPGKAGGAFCIWLRQGDSRVLTNFKPAFGAVSTMAHELGHAYHNLNLASRTPLQRFTPMTMAETASTFCETIVVQAALGAIPPQAQVGILEGALQDSCQIVVDIISRFLFEQQVLDARQKRELSIDELCGFMCEAQRQTYGDALDPNVLHPYMWAAKPHYYSSLFYNYPYMFGLLFGLGLYARYETDPQGFKAGYDDLLSSTGMDNAANLAARFGIDIRNPDFWRASLAVIGANIDRFVKLVGAA